MQKRTLGQSLEVSAIGLGCMGINFHRGEAMETKDAIALLRGAFERGVTFFDTAEAYGPFSNEEIVGEALAPVRDRVVIATKVAKWAKQPGLSAANIVAACESSLKRLQTDYVDLYQCHRYDSETPLEETMEALDRAVDSGKVRYIGFSEWPADKIREALDLSASRGFAKFVSSQPQYSLVWREPEEEVIPLCADNGISQIVWSPLGQGVLSGKYDPDKPPPAGTRATSKEMGGFIERLMNPGLLRAVQRLKPIAEEAGLTMPQFALAWVLREPNIASAIIGASRPEQVRENAHASGLIVDTQLFLRAEAIIDEAMAGAREHA